MKKSGGPRPPPSSSSNRRPAARFGGRPSGGWNPEPKPSRAGQLAADQGSTPSVVEQKEDDVGDPPPTYLPVVGTCPDMCPARERAQRERLRDLSIFERLHGDPTRTLPNLAVKKFCRTLSMMHAQESDIRPPHVLQDTLKYLMNLLDTSDYPYDVVHDFVFDRTRSIRQDLCMQNIVNDQAIHMYEEMVKFHVMSHRKLARCKNDSKNSSQQFLNMEQLMKTLFSLYDLYSVGQKSNFISKNEAEFYSFYILLHLRPYSRSMDDSLPLWFRRLSASVVRSEQIFFARNVLRYFRIGNYRRFLSTVTTGASFLQFCLLEPLIIEVQAQALSYINHCGYKLQPYPLSCISEILMMKESAVESLCTACSLVTTIDEEGIKHLPTKQSGFILPKGGLQGYSFTGSVISDRSDTKVLS